MTKVFSPSVTACVFLYVSWADQHLISFHVWNAFSWLLDCWRMWLLYCFLVSNYFSLPLPPPPPTHLLWQRDCLQFLHMDVLALSWFCFFHLWVCHNATKLVLGHKWTDLNRCPEHNEHVSKRMVSISTFLIITTSCPSCTSQLTLKAQCWVQTTGYFTPVLKLCFFSLTIFITMITPVLNHTFAPRCKL